jgi:uncharacterized protein (DUF2267 family)
MSSTGVRSLDSTVQKTIEWFNAMNEELGWPDRERTYAATKAVLQAIRDRLPYGEAIQFSAPIPMLMKGMYFDQYEPEGKPLNIRNQEEFFQRITENFDQGPLDPEKALRAFIKVYADKTRGGELEDVRKTMPDELRPLFEPE